MVNFSWCRVFFVIFIHILLWWSLEQKFLTRTIKNFVTKRIWDCVKWQNGWNFLIDCYPVHMNIFFQFWTCSMHSEKLINSIEMKKGQVSWLIFGWFFLYKFCNNLFELLLWKINVLDVFNIVDFVQIFVISRSTIILI